MSDPQPNWPRPGMIVSFLANPSSVALGLPTCNPKEKVCCFHGTVVRVAPMLPHGPGKVRSAAVTIRGQSGKVVVVDGAGTYLNAHATLDEAQERPVPTVFL